MKANENSSINPSDWLMPKKKRIQISMNFYLDEYVTKEFYEKWGEKALWWIRPELIAIDQFLRMRFNVPMIINNWWSGGQRSQSGLRYPQATAGAGDSMHKFGLASDSQFRGKSPAFYEEVRDDIVRNFETLYKPLGLTTIEAGTLTWLHKDCRNIKVDDKPFIVYP